MPLSQYDVLPSSRIMLPSHWRCYLKLFLGYYKRGLSYHVDFAASEYLHSNYKLVNILMFIDITKVKARVATGDFNQRIFNPDFAVLECALLNFESSSQNRGYKI